MNVCVTLCDAASMIDTVSLLVLVTNTEPSCTVSDVGCRPTLIVSVTVLVARSTTETVPVVGGAGHRVGDDRRAVGLVGRVTGDGRPAAPVGDERLVADDRDVLRGVADRDRGGQRTWSWCRSRPTLVRAVEHGVELRAVRGDRQPVRE